MLELPDYLPISYLNQLEYCPRRFWLMFVQAEMDINAAVLEGTQQHEHVHHLSQERQGDGVILHRKLYLWSARLKIAGFADLVEEQDDQLIPVEYKHGRMGRWLNDHIQLCAQALCLEEQTGKTVPVGEIFYWGSRRRQTVEISADLRAKTEAAVAQAFHLLQQGKIPPPAVKKAKCRDCSIEMICLPEEVQALNEAPTEERTIE